MLAGAPLFWAGNWVIARALVPYVTPLELTWVRWVLGGAALLAFIRCREGQLPGLSSSLRAGVAVAGGLGMIAYTLLQYEALRHTQAINGTLIFTATPAFTLILAAVFLHERWSPAQLAGILLTLLGVAVILGGGSPLALSGRLSVNAGDAMMLVASWAWAGYTVIARVLTRRISAITLTAYAMVVAAVALAPFQAWQWLAGRGGLPAFLTPGVDAA
ncbi:MAG: DMT family transporter, partial [Bacillota bacterium]